MDYQNILTSGVFMLVIGSALIILLAYLGIKFRVEEDPRISEVSSRLPQANCGACGKAGCHGFAEAVVLGELNVGKCTVASSEKKAEIAEYLGMTVVLGEKTFARLACAGGTNVARNNAEFDPHMSCRDANRSGGGKACAWGCLGLGDCMAACAFDAIVMNRFGLPIVDVDKCTSCGDCVRECPRDLFSIVPESRKLFVACKNLQLGIEAKKECGVACTGCGNCVFDAPKGLIKIENGLAVVDYDSGLPLTENATKNCPTGAIVYYK